jgi:hypothetical protein
MTQVPQELLEESMHSRRLNDLQQEKIDALIAEEPDNKTRLTLMVMSNINKSISANTSLTHAVHNEVKSLKVDFEDHIVKVNAARNEGRGAYKVLRVIVPVLWTIIFAAVGELYNISTAFYNEFNTNVSLVNSRLQAIELKLGIPSKK